MNTETIVPSDWISEMDGNAIHEINTNDNAFQGVQIFCSDSFRCAYVRVNLYELYVLVCSCQTMDIYNQNNPSLAYPHETNEQLIYIIENHNQRK